MSHTGPGEGTLLVNPLLSLSTAYYLLRPFFTPVSTAGILCPGQGQEQYSPEFLKPSNWKLEDSDLNPTGPSGGFTPTLQGAWPGHGQELTPTWHPHLDLPNTMVHVPRIAPGDYVAWHCDTIHAVDKTHAGKADSSVLYIPACPMTEDNANYLVRQR